MNEMTDCGMKLLDTQFYLTRHIQDLIKCCGTFNTHWNGMAFGRKSEKYSEESTDIVGYEFIYTEIWKDRIKYA